MDHNRTHPERRRLILAAGMLLCLLMTAGVARAHRVTLFAWVDGDTVHTQSKFGGGKRVMGMPVVVLDPAGNRLVEGTTDDQGRFSFKVPQQTDLKVVLEASMGHSAEWTVKADELARAAGAASGAAAVAPAAPISESRETAAGPAAPIASGTLSSEDVRRIVDAALDQRLTPLTEMVADMAQKGPGVTEIIGGIGWIFGLVGVALTVSGRRRKRGPTDD